jgi:hypothetical protein
MGAITDKPPPAPLSLDMLAKSFCSENNNNNINNIKNVVNIDSQWYLLLFHYHNNTT